MTRINTNVGSLIAQNTLGRSNANLSQALTRLSTGLRINTGKDDPAGLIASENLRSDITSIRKAISNTDRASQIIATADSALSQVSSLLNDIRGLVTESANSGALSADQIAANQLQLDSSLEALNRIAQSTSFQGRNLLDGSLDFTRTAGSNFERISNLQIDQAKLGSAGTLVVDIAVSAAATQAQVDVTNIAAATAATAASTSATFTDVADQAEFNFDFDTTTGTGINIVAVASGAADLTAGNGITLDLVENSGTPGGVDSVSFSGGKITVNANFASGTLTDTEVAAAIQAFNGGADFTATAKVGSTNLVTADIQTGIAPVYTVAGRAAGTGTITITASTVGTSFNNKTVTVTESNTVTAGNPTATVDGSNNITVLVNDTGTTTLAQIASAIDGLANYSATLSVGTSDGNYIAGTQTAPTVANTTGGAAATGGITNDVVFEVSGATGSEVFSVQAGSGIADLVSQVNLVSDATGVTATANGTTLELSSSLYGTASLVDLTILSEGSGTVPAGTFTTAVAAGSRSTGVDVVAKVNGIDAKGTGNNISINTATLDLTTDLAAGFIGNVGLTITGGGALFQLGPDIVSNQQARIGIGSVNTAKLGGTSGLLFRLAQGGTADLSTDTTTAGKIVEEAIDQVTALRGRLGAFQRTSLETNKNALNDVLVNLTEAESSIRDADFAAESAELTRTQILVQSGTTVLGITNSNPQNVLALLR